MPNDKTSPKWLLPFLTIVAIWFGATLVYDLVGGETPRLYEVAVFVLFAALSIDKWLKRRKDAGAP